MTTPAQPAAPARQGNAFTRKIGPLPMYGWLGIAGGGLLIWAYIAHRNSAASSSSQSGTANASDVPDFINQTYVSTTPPAAPNPGGPVTGTPIPAPAPDNDDSDTISRSNRSPKVKHLEHQINKIHQSSERKPAAAGAKKPVLRSTAPARHPVAHPARGK